MALEAKEAIIHHPIILHSLNFMSPRLTSKLISFNQLYDYHCPEFWDYIAK